MVWEVNGKYTCWTKSFHKCVTLNTTDGCCLWRRGCLLTSPVTSGGLMAFLCHPEEVTFSNRVKTWVIRAISLAAPVSRCTSWGRSLMACFHCYRPCVSLWCCSQGLPPSIRAGVPMHEACKLFWESCEGHLSTSMSFSMSTVTLSRAGAVTDHQRASGIVHRLSMARPTSCWPSSISGGLCLLCPSCRAPVCASLCCFLWNLWKRGHLPAVDWIWPMILKSLQYSGAQTDGQHSCISLVPLIHKAFKNRSHTSLLWHILGFYYAT